jgi:hypothetical protein
MRNKPQMVDGVYIHPGAVNSTVAREIARDVPKPAIPVSPYSELGILLEREKIGEIKTDDLNRELAVLAEKEATWVQSQKSETGGGPTLVLVDVLAQRFERRPGNLGSIVDGIQKSRAHPVKQPTAEVMSPRRRVPIVMDWEPDKNLHWKTRAKIAAEQYRDNPEILAAIRQAESPAVNALISERIAAITGRAKKPIGIKKTGRTTKPVKVNPGNPPSVRVPSDSSTYKPRQMEDLAKILRIRSGERFASGDTKGALILRTEAELLEEEAKRMRQSVEIG